MSIPLSMRRTFALALLMSSCLVTPAKADSVTFNADIPDFGTVELRVKTVTPRTPAAALGHLEVRAIGYATRLMQDWSRPGAEGASLMSGHYDGSVLFYGAWSSHAEVMRDRHDFVRRWPQRNYRVDPASVQVSCGRDCRVFAEYDYDAANRATGARSSGRSTLEITLRPVGDSFVITVEDGAVLTRY